MSHKNGHVLPFFTFEKVVIWRQGGGEKDSFLCVRWPVFLWVSLFSVYAMYQEQFSYRGLGGEGRGSVGRRGLCEKVNNFYQTAYPAEGTQDPQQGEARKK